MSIRLDAMGTAKVQLFVGGDPAADTLLAVGRSVEGVFPDGDPQPPRIDSNGGGYPFVTVSFAAAFAPGQRPLVRIDTRAAVIALAQAGLTSLHIDVTAPHVAASPMWDVEPTSASRGSWSWSSVGESDQPVGTIELRPDRWQGWLQIGLLAIVVLAIGAGLTFWRFGKSRVAIACGAVAIVAALTPIPTAGIAQMDNLRVSGAIAGAVLPYVRWVPAGTMIVGAGAGITLIVLAATKPRTTNDVR